MFESIGWIRKNTKRAVNRRARQNKAPEMGGPLRPPPFESTITFSKRFRFQASSALVDVSVSDSDVTRLLSVAQSPTQAFPIIGAAKIASVELWAPPATTPTSCSVEWAAGGQQIGAPQKIKSDTSMGATYCAHVLSKAPRGSPGSFWLFPNGDEVFSLNGPVGTIVDLTVTFVLANGAPVASTPITISGATAGYLYLLSLDSGGSGFLIPVSYLTA